LVSGLETIAEDEKNLLYVAMTRAKKYLSVNTSVLNLLCSVHHNFEKLKISENQIFEKLKISENESFEKLKTSENESCEKAKFLESRNTSTNCVDCQQTRVDDGNIFFLERPSEFLTFYDTWARQVKNPGEWLRKGGLENTIKAPKVTFFQRIFKVNDNSYK
jgi:hypothetical protein